MKDQRVYTCWVLVERDPAITDGYSWVSHCLHFDVMSQGRTAAEAIERVKEAASMAIVDDLNAGLDPLDRSAPEEDWARLQHIIEHGKPVILGDVGDRKVVLAKQITLAFELIEEEDMVPQLAARVSRVDFFKLETPPLAEACH
jgi:predicted RNase H-like HicB family nuclease